MKNFQKLSLDKKVIAKLNDAQLASLQGGAVAASGTSCGVCTYSGVCKTAVQ